MWPLTLSLSHSAVVPSSLYLILLLGLYVSVTELRTTNSSANFVFIYFHIMSLLKVHFPLVLTFYNLDNLERGAYLGPEYER